MYFFIMIILCGLFVDAIVDLLFSQASIINQYVWEPFQKKLRNVKWITIFYKWVTCPYCFSLWVSGIVCYYLQNEFSEYNIIFMSIIIWRVANFFRLLYNYILYNTSNHFDTVEFETR